VDWKLHNNVLELRYPENFLMWDCAGSLSESLRRAMPLLELSESNPSKVQLNNPQSGLSVYFQTSSLLVNSGLNPKNEFASECDLLTNLIVKKLEIKSLKRIGNRTRFIKTFSDAASASKAIQQFNINNGFTLERFCNPNDSLKKKLPIQFHIQFEDDAGGITIQLSATSLKSKIDQQYKSIFPHVSDSTVYFAEVDFDVYTTGPIDIEACSPQDIIRSNIRMIETLYLPKFTIH
jgi:hypothetical protein